MTSVGCEEEEKSLNCAEEEQEGRKVLPGFLSLLIVCFSSGLFGNQTPQTVRKVLTEANRWSAESRVSQERRMSTSDETDGLRPRYGCKFTLVFAHLEMPGRQLLLTSQLRITAQLLLHANAHKLQQCLIFSYKALPVRYGLISDSMVSA